LAVTHERPHALRQASVAWASWSPRRAATKEIPGVSLTYRARCSATCIRPGGSFA